MKLCLILLFLPLILHSQYNYKVKVTSKDNGDKLSGVSIQIEEKKINQITDSNGIADLIVQKNKKTSILFTYSGYKKKSVEVRYFDNDSSLIHTIELEKDTSVLEEVIVSSTRSNRNIEIIPTRIEAITREDLEEKSSMKPGDIRMLLSESTGIATQQTSAINGSSNIRIQGLNGRFTQLLKDGMPLYNGFSGGLSIMQIPPLDLKQVEIIKGSASTLYGGGAIAGLVNLISKVPTAQKEFTSLLNVNSGKGIDVSSFYSKRNDKIGTTLFASYNHNGAYDPFNIGISLIPKFDRFTFNPKLFLYPSNKLKILFGVNLTNENRLGGDMKQIQGSGDEIHKYYEKNISTRFSTQFSVDYKIDSNQKIQIKNSIGTFNRNIQTTYNRFNGIETSTFSEFNFLKAGKKSDFIFGLNSISDLFQPLDTTKLNYKLVTYGSFVQYTYKPIKSISIESGLRLDYNKPYTLDNKNGLFLLPRVNLLINYNKIWSSRIGWGEGYKMPSPFNDETDRIGYQNIVPINFNSTYAEKSYGLHGDVNFKYKEDEFILNLNQLFFYTNINKPLLLKGNSYFNANGFVDAKGAETNIRIGFDELNFYIGYTYADVSNHINNINSIQTYTPNHRINFDMTYEVENNIRIGLEAFYTGTQKLSDRSTGRSFILVGFLFEKMWNKFTYFINAENVTNQSQVKWDLLYNGSITNPVFKEIYAPLEGKIINTGVKIKF